MSSASCLTIAEWNGGETINDVNCIFTWWESPTFGTVHAMDNEDGETLFMACLNNCDFTSEQAITVTLGNGTCRWLPVESCHSFTGPGWECSNCGHEIGEYEHDFYNCCPICCLEVME